MIRRVLLVAAALAAAIATVTHWSVLIIAVVLYCVTVIMAMRERVVRAGVRAQEAVVPRNGDVQIFLRDPNGVKIELTFTAADLMCDAGWTAAMAVGGLMARPTFLPSDFIFQMSAGTCSPSST